MQDYVRRILSARVYDVAIETPLDRMPRLSARLAAPVWLKREDLQPVFSFKIRGAYNKIAGLDAAARAAGVICASAGNHAQGVALAAGRLGVSALIVMPTTTPEIKIAAVRTLGSEVVLHGDTFDQAYAHARELEQAQGRVFIHPFDDPEVIAGQGTVGVEILRQHPDPIGAVFVPIGGGGLAAGVAAYVKFLRPHTRVIGVEPADAASMGAALRQQERVVLDHLGLFADGAAVRQVGEETFRLCAEHLDDCIAVDTDETCAAIKDIFEDTRVVAEPAGALALAGLKKSGLAARGAAGGALIAVNSGANTNFDRLRHIAERAEIGEGREALLAVTIPERPGAYRAFIEALGVRAITEFNYRRADPERAEIFVGVRLARGEAEKREITSELERHGYPTVDMSDNEMAKLHIRYMVGGPAKTRGDEIVYRFQFPERPGALMQFLSSLKPGWNITLFHYRNHGADYGRVLAGFEIPPADRGRFEARLEALGYPYWDESGNPAYRLFLAGEG